MQPVEKPVTTNRVRIKSVRYFTNPQIARVITTAIVVHNLPTNFLNYKWIRAAFMMASGEESVTMPVYRTAEKYEEEFFQQMKSNLQQHWERDGIVRFQDVGGRRVPQLRQPPLLSVSFDISTTRTKTGLASISTRASWLDVNWELQTVCLGIDAFDLQDPEEEENPAVTAHTGRNIARFVFQLLKDYGLVDELKVYSDGCLSNVICAATVDNAANELNAAGTCMGVKVVNDTCHTLALIMKGGLKVRTQRRKVCEAHSFVSRAMLALMMIHGGFVGVSADLPPTPAHGPLLFLCSQALLPRQPRSPSSSRPSSTSWARRRSTARRAMVSQQPSRSRRRPACRTRAGSSPAP